MFIVFEIKTRGDSQEQSIVYFHSFNYIIYVVFVKSICNVNLFSANDFFMYKFEEHIPISFTKQEDFQLSIDSYEYFAKVFIKLLSLTVIYGLVIS